MECLDLICLQGTIWIRSRPRPALWMPSSPNDTWSVSTKCWDFEVVIACSSIGMSWTCRCWQGGTAESDPRASWHYQLTVRQTLWATKKIQNESNGKAKKISIKDLSRATNATSPCSIPFDIAPSIRVYPEQVLSVGDFMGKGWKMMLHDSTVQLWAHACCILQWGNFTPPLMRRFI